MLLQSLFMNQVQEKLYCRQYINKMLLQLLFMNQVQEKLYCRQYINKMFLVNAIYAE
jgi:hypothetical protein